MRLNFPGKSDRLTNTEQKILEFIEENREEFLFMSIGQVAVQMEVSEATVSRFARHLGCQDFKELKHVVMQQNHLEGPVGKLAGTLFGGENKNDGITYLSEQSSYVKKTMDYLTEKELDDAVKEILKAKRVFIHGKNASSSMAQLLLFRIRRLGIHAHILPSSGTEMLEGLADVHENDLVVLFSFSKVSKEGKVILEHQREAKYRTVVFSSRLHAEKEDLGNVNLFVYRGTEREYHSMTAAVAVIETITLKLSEQMGADGARNLQKLYRLKKKYEL